MGKRYGPRNLQPLTGLSVGRQGGREVQRTTINGGLYVLTYVKCGKPNCSRCTPFAANYDRDRPGHGPYWFRHVRNPKGHTIRKYCGADLQRYFADVATGKRRAVELPAEPSEPQAREAPDQVAMVADVVGDRGAPLLRLEPTSEPSNAKAREEVAAC